MAGNSYYTIICTYSTYAHDRKDKYLYFIKNTDRGINATNHHSGFCAHAIIKKIKFHMYDHLSLQHKLNNFSFA